MWEPKHEMLSFVDYFARDERGAASVEFVTMTPLLAAILVMAAEYGNALMTREALDSALRDATRILSRAPLDETQDSNGNDVPAFFDFFLTEAQNIVAQRTQRQPEDVTFAASASELPGTENFRTPVILIETQATIQVDLPLLAFVESWLNAAGSEDNSVETLLTMNAYDVARYGGETPVGAVACREADRNQGLCGGPS